MTYMIAFGVLGTLCVALGLYAWLTHRRLQHLELLLLRNSQDVACFSDATMAIGNAMQTLLQSPTLAERTPSSSRRQLIAQARKQLEAGEAFAAVVSRYQLGADEQTLLAQSRAAA